MAAPRVSESYSGAGRRARDAEEQNRLRGGRQGVTPASSEKGASRRLIASQLGERCYLSDVWGMPMR